MAKPDSATAMRQLIGQIRQALPFDAPEARLCEGPCEGCSMKLLDYLESEMDGWESRLDSGDKPGLVDLSKLAKSAGKIHKVMQMNGLIKEESEA